MVRGTKNFRGRGEKRGTELKKEKKKKGAAEMEEDWEGEKDGHYLA